MNAFRCLLCFALAIGTLHAEEKVRSQQLSESELNKMIKEIDPMGRIDAWPDDERPIGTVVTCVILVTGYASVPPGSDRERLESSISQILKLNTIANAVMDRYSPEISKDWAQKLAVIRSTMAPFAKTPETPRDDRMDAEILSALETLSHLMDKEGESVPPPSMKR